MRSMLASLYLFLVAITSRVQMRSTSPEALKIFRNHQKAIFCFWFESVFFLLYYLNQKRMTMLTTPLGRSDLITELCDHLKIKTIKGSLEGGGKHALILLLEKLKNNEAVALAADGSRAKARYFRAGPLLLAQESQAPIIPLALRYKYELKWKWQAISSLNIPLPFNRIEVCIGEPTYVNKRVRFEELEAIKVKLSQQLNQMNESSFSTF